MTEQGTLVGSVREVDGTGTVRMEDRFATDIADLWSALTDPLRLARWIGAVEGNLRLGGEFQARFTSSWEGTGRVEICDPPQRLVVRLRDAEGETVVEAELTPAGGHTRLVVEERGFPLGVVAAHGAGWQAHIEDLAAHLAGRPGGDWRARWRELTPAYREQAARLG
jgi:uncharacterized protein YndB with AHSA1/START domain